jgi:putative phage-type endonuclease
VSAVVDREAWLAERRKGIGGSDAAAIAGLDRYRSPYQVWLDKTGLAPDDGKAGEAAEWGNRLEPIVAEVVTERTGIVLADPPGPYQHPDHPFMLGNVDRLAVHPDRGEGIYEGKTVGVWSADEWDDDGVPDRYVLQGQHYLAVTGLPWVLYGCLIGGQKLVTRWVERDDELIGQLTEIEAEFWERVETKTPPPVDGTQATTDLLSRLYAVQAGKVVTVDPKAVEELVVVRDAAKAAEKEAKEAAAEVDNRLRLMIADAEVAVDGDGRVVFTNKEVPAKWVEGYERKAYRRLHIAGRR